MSESADAAEYLRRTACPCCEARLADATLAVASNPPAESMPFDRHSAFASGYGTERVFFSYFRCGKCGAMYCPLFYTEPQLAQLYGQQAENMGEVPLAARLRTQERYAQLLMKHSPGKGAFLEIGPDIGLFAASCAQSGVFDQFWLYEPNRSVHAELASRLGSYRHTIHSSMWPTEDLPPGTVSAAALIHVLDHLLDPAMFLTEIRHKLLPGGRLLIVTHNVDSLLARTLGRRFPPFALQHPQLYSPGSITRLLERSGFTVVQIAAAINDFPLLHLMRAGLAVMGLPRLWLRGQGPLVPIKLGNMAVVATRN